MFMWSISIMIISLPYGLHEALSNVYEAKLGAKILIIHLFKGHMKRYPDHIELYTGMSS